MLFIVALRDHWGFKTDFDSFLVLQTFFFVFNKIYCFLLINLSPLTTNYDKEIGEKRNFYSVRFAFHVLPRLSLMRKISPFSLDVKRLPLQTRPVETSLKLLREKCCDRFFSNQNTTTTFSLYFFLYKLNNFNTKSYSVTRTLSTTIFSGLFTFI